MSEVVLLARAEAHLQRKYESLAETSFDQAEHFDAVINEGLRQLADFPFSAPVFDPPMRRLVISDYSMGIYYVIEGRRIIVHGLYDTRRDPEAIRRELDL